MGAAEALFLENGVQPTTIEQIASRAGVAKGTFYLYYSSKEDIHAALGDRFGVRYLQALTVAVARRPSRDFSGRLEAWSKAAVNGFIEDKDLVNMLFHTHPRPPDGSPNPIVENLAALLKEGVAGGHCTVEDPSSAALFVFGGLHALVDDYLLGRKRLSRAQLLRRIQEFCFAAIGLSFPERQPTT